MIRYHNNYCHDYCHDYCPLLSSSCSSCTVISDIMDLIMVTSMINDHHAQDGSSAMDIMVLYHHALMVIGSSLDDINK